VATHAGNLYALDAATGQAQWQVTAHAPFLQSPGVEAGLVVAGDAAGARRLAEKAGAAGVPGDEVFDKRRIGDLLGRPDTGVIGIGDQGLARALGLALTGLRGLG